MLVPRRTTEPKFSKSFVIVGLRRSDLIYSLSEAWSHSQTGDQINPSSFRMTGTQMVRQKQDTERQVWQLDDERDLDLAVQ
jgi:hypothetical protein